MTGRTLGVKRAARSGATLLGGPHLALPIVSIVVHFLVYQNLYYRILTIKLVNQKKEL